MSPIHIRWSDDGQHIRKWAHAPFDGSTEYTATPRDASGIVYVDGSIYQGMEASLVRDGTVIAHVVDYGVALEISKAMASVVAPTIDAPVHNLTTDQCARLGQQVWNCGKDGGEVRVQMGPDGSYSLKTAGRIVQSLVEKEGYAIAFYDLAEMLGIGARPNAPATVWLGEMKPALAAALNLAAALGRPRAAVGEREEIEQLREAVTRLLPYAEAEAAKAPTTDSRVKRMLAARKDRDHVRAILALQSPPAKVEDAVPESTNGGTAGEHTVTDSDRDFIAAIRAATPNGEPVIVRYAPENLGWSVYDRAKHPPTFFGAAVAEREALIAELSPLIEKAAGPNGWEWMFPLRVNPVDGKEADLLVALANAAPRLVLALQSPPAKAGEARR